MLNLVCGVLKVKGVGSTKMIPIQEGSMKLCMHENMHENGILFLPAYILTM